MDSLCIMYQIIIILADFAENIDFVQLFYKCSLENLREIILLNLNKFFLLMLIW